MANVFLNLKHILIFSGSIIAFMVGSAFASGQEVLQYYTAYGLKGCILGGFVTFIIFYITIKQVLTDSYHLRDKDSLKIFQHYCGKTLGTVYKWIVAVFIYLAYIVMLSGCGALFEEQLRLDAILGVLLIAVLTSVVTAMGMKRLTDILGFLGPLMIIMILIVSVLGLCMNLEGIAEAEKTLSALTLKKASPYWLLSAVNYPCFALIGAYPFLFNIGSNCKTGEPRKIALISCGFFVGTIIVMGLAMLGCLDKVYNLNIPIAYIADQIIPGLGSIFAIVMFFGIFTTAVPLLWQSAHVFSTNEHGRKYKCSVILLAAIGCIGAELPFASLVNIIFPIQGYLGIFLVAVTIGKAFINCCIKLLYKIKRS